MEDSDGQGGLKAIIYQSPNDPAAGDNGGGRLRVLDQLKLPLTHEYIEVEGVRDAVRVIKDMNVRGAPAIAIVAVLSVALDLHHHVRSNEELKKRVMEKSAISLTEQEARKVKQEIRERVMGNMRELEKARPTAVNLKRALADMDVLCASYLNEKNDQYPGVMYQGVISYAENLFRDDVLTNLNLAKIGASDILLRATKDDPNSKVSVLTYCNTGSLATAGHGTALGIVRTLHSMGRLELAYCCETRPYNQGSRLTAFELVHDQIPSCYICDNAAAALMKTKTIHAVIVGADRVARNGDTANKIGTLSLAIAAKHLGVPFYVACPTTTIDMATGHGDQIPIEGRSVEEMVTWHVMPDGARKRVPPEGIACWNPAFDVTPAELITGGIVTEHGIFMPPLDAPETVAILGPYVHASAKQAS